jgi:uncharacterized protein (DUF362 family)
MRRRDFLKLCGSSLLAGKLLVGDLWAAKEPSVVTLSEGTDYMQVTKSVIEALGGMKRFVKSGDIVVVKPNMGWDRRPEFGANTHPLVMKAIVEEALKAGAKRVKVFDNPCNEPRRCYENSGIPAALKGMENVEVKQMEDERYRKVKLNGVALKEWELYSEATSANVFINVPIAKHHSLTRLSLASKNVMGIMGGNRGYIHRDIEDALADVNMVVKSHLTIMDATRILTNHGPSGGSLKDVKILNRVIASTDIVAVDAYATTLFGIAPKDISITVTAAKRGLGEMDLGKVKVVKA